VDGRASVIASSPSLLGRGCWFLGPMGSSLGERELEVSIPGLFARGCCRSHYQLHINSYPTMQSCTRHDTTTNHYQQLALNPEHPRGDGIGLYTASSHSLK
jgi:hypothetical protein